MNPSRTAAPARRCLPCALLRRAGQGLMLVLLPRTFAFLAALVILVLMAPSSIPTPKPKPALPALPKLPDAAALKGTLQGAAQSLKDAAASAATAAAASAAAPAIARVNAAASAANAAAANLTAKVGAAASSATAAAASAAAAGGGASAASGAGASSPATAIASAAASAASAASAATTLRFSPTALPAGRVGVLWKPRKMVELGKPPYSMEFVGPRPAWITEYAAGTLSGTPDQTGTYTFTLRASGQSPGPGLPRPVVEQTFTVRVLDAPAAQPKPRPKPTPVGPLAPPTTERYLPQTFRLETADLEEWPWDAKATADGTAATRSAPAATSTTPATEPPAGGVPVKKRWTDMLAPLAGLDFPTEALFRDALALAHCSAYQALQAQNRKAAAPAGGPATASVEDPCPPEEQARTQLAEGEVCAAGLPGPADGFNALMPPAVRECLVRTARRLHRPKDHIPTRWTATPGCGCVPPAKDDEVYGFITYWGSTEQQQAAAAAGSPASAPGAARPAETRLIDFSLYTRINYFGAVLNDKGGYVLPAAVAEQGARLAHDALQHQTQTDLVIYRNDWDFLLDQPAESFAKFIEEFAKDAAANAVGLVNVPQPFVSGLYQALLLPFWREPKWTYGGLTVFFDNVPAAGTPAADRYAAFLKPFMKTLILRLQEQKRAYHLNVVVPGNRLADTGPFSFRDMKGWIESAEKKQTSKQVEADKKVDYKGTTEITVEYIVLLNEPATDSKKDLRARVDGSEVLSGTTRVAFLQSTVPLLLPTAADQPPWLSKTPEEQRDDDLAYMKWNFGGVSVWELPAWTADNTLMKQLDVNFREEHHQLAGLCTWVCPNRLALRLLMQVLVLVGGVALGVWLVSCTVRSWGRPYRYFLGGGFLVTLLLYQAMLQCDPALKPLADSPVPALVYLALVLGAISRFIFITSHEDTA